jgi:LmbE family N-acetylglucosaminyl deacetylase
MIFDAAQLPACDSLYLSPHPDDILLACPARLVYDLGRAQRVLVLTLFGGAAGDECAALMERLGVMQVGLGLKEAGKRHAAYGSYRGLTFSPRESADEDLLHEVAAFFNDVAHRLRPRQVLAPLGVGSHVDHCLVHEAARAAFAGGEARDVFLYEERPEALVPGAVRIRLGQIGAQLPPAASPADGTSLWRFLRHFHLGPAFRGDLRGLRERLDAVRPALELWRTGRGWQPQRSRGPRVQPVLFPAGEDWGASLGELRAVWPPALRALAAAYADRLGGGPYAERYWLLLPPRESDGVERLVRSSDEAASSAAGSASQRSGS